MTTTGEQTLVTGEDASLQSLAAQINDAHGNACRAAQSAITHARRAGELLIEAKAGLEHGSWLSWLGECCPTISERTAQAYMRVARDWPTLEAKAQRVADLPLRDALALLAEPREAEPAADTEEEAPPSRLRKTGDVRVSGQGSVVRSQRGCSTGSAAS